MKKYAWIIAGLFYGSFANADVTLQNLGEVPAANIAESYTPNLSGTYQTRNTVADLSNWRGVTQTFRWQSETSGGDHLDSIGLHFDDGQTVWPQDQQYILVIHELAARTGTPTNTVAEFVFTLPKEYVIANTWLKIDMDNQTMVDDQWYGFTVIPKSDAVVNQIAYWNQTSQATAGGATLYNASNNGYPTSTYGSSGTGVAFFLQSSTGGSAPAKISLIVFSN